MLLPRIERYLKSTRTPPARFGRQAMGDPAFVFDLRDGRDPREQTIARVNAYLDGAEGSAATGAGAPR